MIYLLYGPDTYRSRQKLKEIVAEYQKKAGAVALHRFDAEEDDLARMKLVVKSSSLFSLKKLVVMLHALSDDAAFSILCEIAPRFSSSNNDFVILWERSIEGEHKKRFEELRPYLTKIQEFKLLTHAGLNRFIAEEAEKRNLRPTSDDLVHLSSCQNNLWALVNEIEKLSLAKEPGVHNRVQKYLPESEPTVFHLGDTFLTARREALRNLLRLLYKGEDESALFSYLANYTRTLCTVKHYSTQQKEVPAHHGIHPFVIKKASALVRALTPWFLYGALTRFFREDHKIKTGLSRPKDSLINILLNAQDK